MRNASWDGGVELSERAWPATKQFFHFQTAAMLYAGPNMSAVTNLALRALLARIKPELTLAQVRVVRMTEGYELRHLADREAATLREVTPEELRSLAQFTEAGAFRPLKSAPNLQAGWRCLTRTEEELETALRHLYPGAVADWYAAQSPRPPVTHYREFTARQTGMYRATALLTDEQAAQVARAGCHQNFCLKQRLWTVEGWPPGEARSLIPCLEPCAVLLEFARKAQRIELEGKPRCNLAFDDAQAAQAALQIALRGGGADGREADFNAADNPRRRQLVLDKLTSYLNHHAT